MTGCLSKMAEDEDLDLSEIMNSKETIRDLIPTFLWQNDTTELEAPLDNMLRNLGIFNEMGLILEHSQSTMTEKQKGIFNLFMYLSLTEGIFSELVNIIAFMRTLSENKLPERKITLIYSKRKKKEVLTYKEISEEDLFIRLNYVGHYETSMGNLLSNCIDRVLRNCIAHLNFTVNDDGTVINGVTKQKISSHEAIKSLMAAILTISYTDLQPLIQAVRQPELRKNNQ